MKKIIALLCIGTLLLTATVILTSHIDAVNSGTYNNPPYQPSNPDPQNNSIDVTVTISLSWDGGDPDSLDTVKYEVYLGTTPNPPFLDKTIRYPSNQTQITYKPYKLNYSTQYYWKINAKDSSGILTTCPIWTFNTSDNNPPYTPHNPNPPDNSIKVIVNTMLTWNGGDPDDDVVTYNVYFGLAPNPPNVAIDLSDVTYNPGPLEYYNMQYYWRIDAIDSSGAMTTGHTWTFITEILQNTVPDKPYKPYGPTAGVAGVSYSYSSFTTDSDGDQLYYLFDWGDGTQSDWIGPFDPNQRATGTHIWASEGAYPVKVKAKDEHGGESEWSDPLPVAMPKSYENSFTSLLNIIGEWFTHLFHQNNIQWCTFSSSPFFFYSTV